MMIEARKLDELASYHYDFSICTLVTDKSEYNEMLDSFAKSGFVAENCEFLYADNSEVNRFEAYSAINRFLREAKGEYIIICHQDIVLIDDKSKLDFCIGEVSKLDPSWAVLSNAGGVGPNYFSILISYPGNITVKKGNPPEKVKSVDENFLLIKSSANLALSYDLNGFHMYGTDLCLIADILGLTAYTIPFGLLHKSKGKISEEFWRSKSMLIKKYNSKLKGRWIQTTITSFFTGGSIMDRFLMGNRFILIIVKSWNSLKKKRKLNEK